MGCGGLGKPARVRLKAGQYLARFSDDPTLIKLLFSPAGYTTSTGSVRGSWHLQVYVDSAFPRGIQRNADESRDTAVASWLSSCRRFLIVFQSFFFLGCEVWSSCPWVVCGVLSVLTDVGWFLPIVFSPADPHAQVRVRVWVIRSILEAQDYRLVVFVHIRPADALLSPEPGGDQGTLFARNIVQGYVRACVLFSCVVFVLLFSARPFPPSWGCK